MSGKRRLFYDEEFFNEPSNLNCYWAGFIAADGHITHELNCVSINLGIQDKDHLQTFSDSIGFTGTIKIRKDERAARLRLNHAHKTCHALASFNITPKKSETLCPPSLSGDLALSFIAGYIDGDGWITPSGNTYVLGVLGTLPMIEWIQTSLSTIDENIQNLTLTRRKCSAEVYQLQIHKASRSIHDRFRELNVPLLERKWARFTEKDDGHFR